MSKSERSANVQAGPEKPSLQSILNEAVAAYSSAVRKYYDMGVALVKAITFYGLDGKKQFRTLFPLTDNCLTNLEYVGRGKLLPQFLFCSNKFVSGLVRLRNSLSWQYKLLGASQDGHIRVIVDGKIVDKEFKDFINDRDVEFLLSITSEENKDLTPDELAVKIRDLYDSVRSKFAKRKRKAFVFNVTEDGKKTVKFLKSVPYTVEQLEQIIAQMKADNESAA